MQMSPKLLRTAVGQLNRASVVPENEIAVLPAMAINKTRIGTMDEKDSAARGFPPQEGREDTDVKPSFTNSALRRFRDGYVRQDVQPRAPRPFGSG